jgi:hypothetical protein
LTSTDRGRVAVLLGLDGSLTPVEIASSAEGLTDVVLVLDATDRTDRGRSLVQVAQALAPTVFADFRDPEACRAAVQRTGATAVTTFVDGYCALASRLNGREAAWGRKDRQRELLRDAGISRIAAARVHDEVSLRAFVASFGLPVVVKPVDGAASENVWHLRHESDVEAFLAAAGTGPRRALAGLLAEQYIVGHRRAQPYLGDYVSAEVFRWADAAADPYSFVTDRLRPSWPCRETGLVLPTQLPPAAQKPVLATADRAVSAVGGWHGAFHVELKPTEPEPEVIEVNGRLGGYLNRLVRYGTGVDLGRVALSTVVGERTAPALDWRRCVLVLLFPAPPAARRVTAGPTRRELARLPAVLAVDDLSPAGTPTAWLSGSRGAVATLWLAAPTHDELHARLVDTASFLHDRFRYVDHDGQPVVDASWLEQICGERHQADQAHRGGAGAAG